MRRLMTLLGVLALMLAIGASANAGYWEVTYDLATTTVTTNSPAGSLTDPLSGKWRFRYDSLSKPAPAPYSGARMVAGTQHITLSQVATAVLLTLTGTTNGRLLPAAGGQPAVIAGATLQGFTVDDNEATGYNHCYGPFCVAAGFTVGASVPIPLTPPGPGPNPFAIPNIKFASNVGVGNFTADPKIDVVGANTNIVTVYRGVEVSRFYITGDVPALGGGALTGLAAFLLIGGTSTLALRHRRH